MVSADNGSHPKLVVVVLYLSPILPSDWLGLVVPPSLIVGCTIALSKGRGADCGTVHPIIPVTECPPNLFLSRPYRGTTRMETTQDAGVGAVTGASAIQ
ncbi:hypothetical protein AB205_0156930 [Aquarana catesbeiana]|uniref:Uncharacterized protein n=1 Tax=Aquarana catesbeiana TaxID=8400 RepID=A0A2G9QKY2_AQUCT|nr:hypothetical protein AB205_0156930 [Aquarana catesbeiana]